MAGIGNEDSFLAALRDEPVRPLKRKVSAEVGATSSKRVAPPPVTGVAEQPARQRPVAPAQPEGTLKARHRRTDRVEKGKAPDARSAVVRPQPKPDGTPRVAPMMKVMGEAMGRALEAALVAPTPDNFLEVALDSQEHVAKVAASCTMLVSALAVALDMTPEELKSAIADHERKRGTEVVSKRFHDSEMNCLAVDYEKRLESLRAIVASLQADVEAKQRAINEQDAFATKAQESANRKINELKKARDDLNLLLSDSRSRAQDTEDQLVAVNSKFEKFREFLREDVPKMKRNCYKDCMEMMLKKIRFTFPEANLSYFADVDDVPEVEIDAGLLADFADVDDTLPAAAGAEQEVAGQGEVATHEQVDDEAAGTA